jgi:ABC-2 type transport system permease protein
MMIICDQVDQLSWLHPWLLTHWWTAFGGLLRDPVATVGIEQGLLVFGAYGVVFWLLAWARFTTKDVTS